jgi:hypothetical protein
MTNDLTGRSKIGTRPVIGYFSTTLFSIATGRDFET